MVVAALVAAIAGSLVGVVLADAFDGEPEYDGDFVLEQPGVFQQPDEDINVDTSGGELPDVPIVDADGNEVSLAAYAGRPLVVNFWFSRCAPCRRELRDFAEVHAEVGDRVQFVGVDPFDTVEAMERFAGERGVTYPLLRDPERSLTNALSIVGYPVTLFVDADGTILRQTGVIDADGLRSAIEELF